MEPSDMEIHNVILKIVSERRGYIEWSKMIIALLEYFDHSFMSMRSIQSLKDRISNICATSDFIGMIRYDDGEVPNRLIYRKVANI